jgi:hypothetical protein
MMDVKGLVATVIVPALVGAAFGTGSSLAVIEYQQSRSRANLETAFAGEVDAILEVLRQPTHFAVDAWENKRRLPDYTFYFPRAVYDGNVGRLGDLKNRETIREIAYLYAVLEQAQHEAKRLQQRKADKEGMLRYISSLTTAYTHALLIRSQLPFPAESPGMHPELVKEELKYIKEATAKIRKELLPEKKDAARP